MMFDDKLEPDLRAPYENWKANPTPEANAEFLTTLDPIINKAINTHVGKPNPLTRSRARRMALEGMQKYDPSRSRLQTHLYSQLQGLKRYSAQQAQGVKIPERVSLDKHTVDTVMQELSDELGREPSDVEISERAGMSMKRLQHVRKFNPSMSEGFFQGVGERGGGSFMPGVEQPDSDIWLEMIHQELDPIDQKILEYSTGLYGNQVLSTNEIAAKLKRSAGAISQRKAKIQQLVNQEDELSPFK